MMFMMAEIVSMALMLIGGLVVILCFGLIVHVVLDQLFPNER